MKNSKINSKSKLKIIIMSLMAIFVIFGSLGACSAVSTNDKIIVSLAPQTQQVYEGQQVQMDVWVNNSNITVEGFESTFAYDANNLKLTNIQLSDLANTAGLKDVQVASNSISLAWMGGGITETNFSVATLTFETYKNSTNEILLRNIDLTTNNGLSTLPIPEHILNGNVEILESNPNITEVTILPEPIYEGIVTLDVESKVTYPGFANESMDVNFSLNDKNYTMNYDTTSKSFKVQVPDLVLGVGTLSGKVSAQSAKKVAQKDVSIVVTTPDIEIGEITVDNPYYSTPAKITVPLSNKGSATLSNNETYTISVYADSTLLKTVKVNPLAVGETQDVVVDWTAEKPSTKIIAQLSFDDENTANNKVLKTIEVTEKPISVNLTENISTVKAGEYFNISIDLNKLDGFRNPQGFEFVLNFDKNLVSCEDSKFQVLEGDINLKLIDINNDKGTIQYSIITNGINEDSTVAKAKFKALKPGNLILGLKNVSISDKSSEFNNIEVNNTTVEIIGSDIEINSIIPDSYNIGQKVILDVEVANNGHVDVTKPFKVLLYVDANNPIEKTIESLEVGATETLQFEWANNARTNTLITIVADESNAVLEESESNNRISKSVKVVDDAINVYTAKEDTEGNSFIFTLNAKDVAEYRKCAGFEGTLNLKNLVVKNYTLSGNFSNYNAETGYFGGFNFTENKYDEFELANFVLEIVNTSKPYCVNITGIDLSDEQSNSYGNVTFNTTSIIGGAIIRSSENVGGDNLVINANGNTIEYVEGEILWSTATEYMPAGNRIGLQIVGLEGVDTSNSKIKVGDIESKWDEVKGINNTLYYYPIVTEENREFTITAVWNNVSTQVFKIVIDDNVALESLVIPEELAQATTTGADTQLKGVTPDVSKAGYVTVDLTTSTLENLNETAAGQVYPEFDGSQETCPVWLGLVVPLPENAKKAVLLNGDEEDYYDESTGIFYVSVGEKTTADGQPSDKQADYIKFVPYEENEIVEYTFKFMDDYDNPISVQTLDVKVISEGIVDNFVEETIGDKKIDCPSTGTINTTPVYKNEEFNVSEVSFGDEDNLYIPLVKDIKVPANTLAKIEKLNKQAEEIKNKKVSTKEDIEQILNNSLNNITEVLNDGFTVSDFEYKAEQAGNTVNSKLTFKALNDGSKGVTILRVPTGNLKLDEITVDTGSKNITLKEKDFNSTVGWYRMLNNGVVELTLVKDPVITMKLTSALPVTDSGSSSSGSSGGSRHHSTSDSITTSSMISDSKIVYANLDKSYAKSLKSSICECTEDLKINDDTIIVGGPLANALTKAYMNQFPVSITNSNPGENKGIIQMMTIKSEGTGIVTEYNVVLLAGSDRFGTQAAVEYFKSLSEVPEEPIYVEWVDGEAKKIN
ncbi:CARDB domain-containing protein [Methanococcus voltae]|uniref:CARDB domain-containing protein n=1 Tax=Methanococcus voltae TaxID=2188 RepID=UPI001AE5B4CA|nr:CARDB domain-containing protein [Methanococcus voltae]MBP2171970.1 hypothetical protein [Methanococcus voltae]